MLPEWICVNPYVVVVFVCLCVVFVYRYMLETYSVIQKLGIPCLKPVWVFGNTLEMKGKNPLAVFQEWQKAYGDVYGFYEGFRAGLVVHGPEMANEILSKHFNNFHARPGYRPFQYSPDELQLNNIEGEDWKNQRALMNKVLHSAGHAEQLVDVVAGSSEMLTENLEKQRTLNPDGFNVSPIIDKYISSAMSKFLLGMNDDDVRCHGDDIYEWSINNNKAASPEYELVGLAMLFPSLSPLLRLFNTEHKRCHDKVAELLKKYIATTASGQNNNNDLKQADHSTLLSHLISATVQSRDIDGSLTRRRLTNQELLAHAFTLLSETFTTMSASISFMLYELARNPRVQDKLYEEICRIYNKDPEFQLSSLRSMTYCEQVFKETYRLHPLAPGLQRTCTSDCTINGYRFKKGMVVRVMTSTMYNDESLYPNPETFDPERFSQENGDDRPVCSFLPFGLGPRRCPGQKLAPFTMKLIFIHILTRYRLSLTENTEVPIQHAFRPILAPKNGVHLRLEPRC